MVRAIRWQAFAAAYLAAFFLSTAIPTPLLWYLPIEHRFSFGLRIDGLGVDFYGRVLFSSIIGAAGAAVGQWLATVTSAPVRARWVIRLGIWSLLLLVFTACLYVYLLASRHAPAVPLPEGYVPR